MLNLILTSILPLINKVIPDKDKAQELAHEIATLTERQAHELAKLQVETNKAEAAHKSLFVAGWRPSVGWICTFSLGVNYVFLPIVNYVGVLVGTEIPPFEPFNMETMMPVLLGMLGLGGMRSYEKSKGVAREK